MDIEIPERERRRAKLRKWIYWGGGPLLGVLIVGGAIMMASPRISRDELIISRAERGDVESAVSATGHVVPALEVIMTSPVSASILEIYCREGDKIEAGTPLLRLDLQSAEDEYQRINDQLAMKRNEIEQGRLNSETKLTDLEMRIRTRQMAADQLKAQVENERRLDSIGSGTGDRIRQAELAYRTACLEIEQMKRQLANEKRVESAGQRTRELEAAVTGRSLEEAARTLRSGRLTAPISGTITYLNTAVGAMAGAGEKMAVVSDLTRFKVEAEVSEGHSDKVTVGAPVILRIGKNQYRGSVSNLTAQSSSGVVKFSVALDSVAAGALRAGLSTKVNVIYDLKEDVVRIPLGSYYTGPGQYELMVSDGENSMSRRLVSLGDASAEWVEVRSGISPGNEVLTGSLDRVGTRQKIRLK